MNEVDIRERSAINRAIDADKRYTEILITLFHDVAADIQVL